MGLWKWLEDAISGRLSGALPWLFPVLRTGDVRLLTWLVSFLRAFPQAQI